MDRIPLLLKIGGLILELFLSFAGLYPIKVTFGLELKREFIS